MHERTLFQLRTPVLSDASEIARLSDQLGYPSNALQVAERLTTLLTNANHFIAVASTDDSILLGWIAAERRLLLESGDRGEVVGMVVDITARRRGIGRTLVKAAECWLMDQGVNVMSVRSNVVRPESHRFYESLGYLVRKTQHSYAKQL